MRKVEMREVEMPEVERPNQRPTITRSCRTGRGRRYGLTLVLLAGFLLLAAGTAAVPEGASGEPAAPASDAVQRGHDLFVVHCSNCHGKEGRGDGPMADVLKVAPTDLTRLASDAGGTFPRHAVHRAIDGRAEIRSHGRRQMPVWGLAFQERGRVAEQEGDVQARIADLVTYLESIQRD